MKLNFKEQRFEDGDTSRQWDWHIQRPCGKKNGERVGAKEGGRRLEQREFGRVQHA